MNYITVFTGPMKCGKTSRLIEEFNKYKYSDRRIMMFKPSIDDRFEKAAVCDRNHNKIECVNIYGLNDLEFYKDKVDVFFIDEFQFLGGDISPLLDLVAEEKIFYISGLNLTAERKPFGLMHHLLCIADNIINLDAVCDDCKEFNAKYSYFKPGKSVDIVIGDEQYTALCPKCYNKRIMKKDE